MVKIIKFGKVPCQPCVVMDKVLDVVLSRNKDINMVSYSDEDKYMLSNFEVSGYPTTIFLKHGREVDRLVGTATKVEIEQSIKRAREF